MDTNESVKAVPDRRKFARNAGIVGLIGFVLPWVSCNSGGLNLNQTMSGMDVANSGQGGLLWLVPAGFGLAILLAVLVQPATAAERLSRAKFTVIGGLLALAVMFIEYMRIKDQSHAGGMFGASVENVLQIQYGAYISAVAAVGVVLGGWQQQIGEKRDGG